MTLDAVTIVTYAKAYFLSQNIVHTVRWLTVDTSTTTSLAQSCSAGGVCKQWTGLLE